MSAAEQFGVQLRKTREAKELTQERLATTSGLHRTEISLLERGRRAPGLETIVLLASALEVKPSDLLKGIR